MLTYTRLLPLLTLLVVQLPITLAVDTDVNPSLNSQLKLSVQMLDQQTLLNSSDYLYDFSTNPHMSLSPGSVLNADAATFPILSTIDMTVAQINLGPCAMLPPHLHRATNLLVAVTGSTSTYMYQENGARVINQTLTPGKMTVFPKMSLHTMVNEDCGNNLLYAFLDSNDATTLNVANALMLLPQEIVTTVMPFMGVQNGNWNATGNMVPPVANGAVGGYADCLTRCGLGNGTSGSQGGARGRE